MNAGGPSQFPETIWSRIKQAADKQSTAVNDFISSYKEPVLRFLIRRGVPQAEAEDIAQEVFLKVFEQDLLHVADSNKGRFRSFILGVTKNVIVDWNRRATAEKRGSGRKIVSLDQPVPGDSTKKLSDMLSVTHTDADFDSLWMGHVLTRALDQLQHECKKKELPYYEVMRDFVMDNNSTYESIAKSRNLSFDQVKNYIFRAKKKLISYVRAEIQRLCSSQDEFEEELKYLSQYLKLQK